jgi:hypothetical protein
MGAQLVELLSNNYEQNLYHRLFSPSLSALDDE